MKEVNEAKVQNENQIENEKILSTAENTKEVNEAKAQNESSNEGDRVLSIDEVVEEVSLYVLIPDMTISRKVVKKSGKVYKDYYVNGMLRGVPVQVRVLPGKNSSGFTDVSAYTYLDLVFGNTDTASFAVQTFKRRDTVTNRLITGLYYFAYIKDGVEYTAPLRFDTASDKALISKMIEVANNKHGLGISM